MKLAEQTADEILKLGTILSCCIEVAAEHDHSVISIYVSTHSLSTSFFFMQFYRCSVNSEVQGESYRNKRNILARGKKPT